MKSSLSLGWARQLRSDLASEIRQLGQAPDADDEHLDDVRQRLRQVDQLIEAMTNLNDPSGAMNRAPRSML